MYVRVSAHMYVCVCVRACAFVYTLRWWITRKQFHHFCSQNYRLCELSSKDVIVTYGIYLLFEDQRFSEMHLESSDAIISQTAAEMANFTIDIKYEFEYGLHVYILLWPLLKVKVKVMYISTENISQTVIHTANFIIAIY